MKLLVIIANKDDADGLVRELTEKEFSTTRLISSGGFLNSENATFLVGTEDKKVDEVVKVVKECCHSRKENISHAPDVSEPGEFVIPESVEVNVGGATIFVLDVADFKKI